MADEHGEFYNILLSIKEDMGEIKGDVKGINQRLDVSNGRLSKHDEKLQDIQDWRATMTGKVGVWAGLVGLASSVVVSFIISKFR